MPKTLRSPEHIALMGVLREARLTAGMTQAELAGLLGRPQSYVAKIETGERRVEVVEFILMARAVGRKPGEILREVEARNASKNET
ncbi:helix-turn-helix domain-containing protein [Jannaschia aquimarina]|uniref:Helix-turn-helix protein n=1 Tax=Jannaschia aquimarina TaxID=935700 RepID=A0A0D1ECX1_9RHOB|nr:helix-turn-helix transcriptional regulator [Jannaschia aquimarina]KIT15579.1 helix-turn-helix protein [Jannaschia aquimarina]SNT27215.1 transcriptional regulator, XRE family [Jannaschia aquimarina]